MTRREFYAEMEGILELRPGTIKGTEALSEWESWDSLAMLCFIAMADSRCGTFVSRETLEHCSTVADLVALFPAGMPES